jgi:hypothetical protein
VKKREKIYINYPYIYKIVDIEIPCEGVVVVVVV